MVGVAHPALQMSLVELQLALMRLPNAVDGRIVLEMGKTGVGISKLDGRVGFGPGQAKDIYQQTNRELDILHDNRGPKPD